MLDFGIATRIGAPDEDEDGETFGTPAYVAPERLDGAPAQPSTDVYSLGVLLHEALTGRVPYPADTWEQLSAALASGPPPTLADLPGPAPIGGPGLPAQPGRDPADRPTARQVATVLRDHSLPTGPGRHHPRTHADPATASPAVATANGTTRRPTGGGLPWPPPAEPGRRAGRLVTARLVLCGAGGRGDADRGGPAARTAADTPGAALRRSGGDPVDRPAGHRVVRAARPRHRRRGRAPAHPPPNPGTLAEAANRVDGLIGAGLSAGEIRDDVALDLRNELRNLTAAVGSGREGLAPPVARLRDEGRRPPR